MKRSILTSATCAIIVLLLSACAQKSSVKQDAPPTSHLTPYSEQLSADGLFAFGKADLKNLSDAGRAELDALAARVMASGGNFQIINVIGHSDRIGSDQANLKLSARRAEAVRDYLVERGIPADKISAAGRGSMESVVECGNERGQALIDCLAPNRRVEIRVVPIR